MAISLRRLLAWLSPLAMALPAAAQTLAPCPDKPNCVSSLATDGDHRVEPFAVAGDLGWAALREAAASLPRTRIVEERPGYLHAECTSRLFRFVDDLELLRNEAGDRVDVRSASRTGYGDWGVNRARVESLREALVKGPGQKPAP
jgi:uncharacterized protein (DUF1499 family)